MRMYYNNRCCVKNQMLLSIKVGFLAFWIHIKYVSSYGLENKYALLSRSIWVIVEIKQLCHYIAYVLQCCLHRWGTSVPENSREGLKPSACGINSRDLQLDICMYSDAGTTQNIGHLQPSWGRASEIGKLSDIRDHNYSDINVFPGLRRTCS